MNKDFTDLFCRLVEAYEEVDKEKIRSLTTELKEYRLKLRTEVSEDLIWEESQVDGFTEAPLVIQTYKVFLGNDEVFKGERHYGSEMIDPTHTGMGGRWDVIRVDDGGYGGVFALLENFGLEVEAPEVPAWKKE
jgi:hypothetical protein